MRVRKINESPQFPVKAGQWDALWVLISERKSPRPLVSQTLRDLDWRLQGLLSRYLLNPISEGDSRLTYIPVEHRLGIRFLVIDSAKNLSKKNLDAVAKGIGAKKILIWPEDPALSKWLEKQCAQLGKETTGKDKSDLDEIGWGEDAGHQELNIE